MPAVRTASRLTPFQDFFKTEAAGGALLVVCAAAALILVGSVNAVVAVTMVNLVPEGPTQDKLFVFHKSLGVLILILMVRPEGLFTKRSRQA